MLLQKKSGDGQEFLSRKKLSRKKLSIFVSKVGPATGVRNQDDSTMDLTELAVAMGSLLLLEQ